MSPEQTDPRAGISPATDVWALGLIVYWLMTGRPYWVSAGDPTLSMHAVMREILFEPMAPASARAEQRGAADRLPPGFDGWFARCVAREPKARFATATELLESFEQICNGFEADAIGPPASIAGSLVSESSSPLSTRSYLAGAGMRAGPSSTRDGDAGTAPGSARDSQPSARDGSQAVPAGSGRVSPPEWKKKAELASSGPTGSAFVASSPPAGDAGDRDGATSVRPRSTHRNMALGMGIGLLAAAGAVFGVRGLMTQGPVPPTTVAQTAPSSSVSSDPVLVAPRNTAVEAIPSASAQAIPLTSASSLPIATAAPERPTASSRKPLAPANPGPRDAGAAEPSPEAKPPFNLTQAVRAVEDRARIARMACANMTGPKVVSGIVYFSQAGHATRLDGDMGVFATQTGFCVKSQLLSAHVSPFEGESQGVPAAVALQ
jgi:hypothetical protein